MLSALHLEFKILHSNDGEIVTSSFHEPVVLYAVSSMHKTSTYQWRSLDHKDLFFPSTPCVYVRKCGVFTCTVACGTRAKELLTYSVSCVPEGNMGIIDAEHTSPYLSTLTE